MLFESFIQVSQRSKSHRLDMLSLDNPQVGFLLKILCKRLIALMLLHNKIFTNFKIQVFSLTLSQTIPGVYVSEVEVF